MISGMLLLIALLATAKMPFVVNDAVTALKLTEKGFKPEHLSLTVLLDFPFQILIGYQAARFARGSRPLKPVGVAAGRGCACVAVSHRRAPPGCRGWPTGWSSGCMRSLSGSSWPASPSRSSAPTPSSPARMCRRGTLRW